MARRGRPPRASATEASGEWQKPEAVSVAYVLPEPAPISDADVQYVSRQIVQARVDVVAPAEPPAGLPSFRDISRIVHLHGVTADVSLPPCVVASTRIRSAIASHRADDAHDMTAALEAALHRIDELRNALPAAIEAAGPEHAPALRDLLNII